MPRKPLDIASLEHDLKALRTMVAKAERSLHLARQRQGVSEPALSKGRPQRPPVDGPRLGLEAEFKLLDAEVLGTCDHIPRAIGRELAATLMRLEAHGHREAIQLMVARYGVDAAELQHCARELSAELVAARIGEAVEILKPRPASEKTIQLLIDELSEPR